MQAVGLERRQAGGRVREDTKVGPVVADALAAVGLQRRSVDCVLILRAWVLQRATGCRKWHVELHHLQTAASAVPGGQHAVVAVVDHPRRAPGRLVATNPAIVAERPVIGRATDRIGAKRLRRTGDRVANHQAVVAGVWLRQQLDQNGVAVEVCGGVLPLANMTQVLGLHGTVEQRGDAQERAILTWIGAAGQQDAFVFEPQPAGARHGYDLGVDDLRHANRRWGLRRIADQAGVNLHSVRATFFGHCLRRENRCEQRECC